MVAAASTRKSPYGFPIVNVPGGTIGQDSDFPMQLACPACDTAFYVDPAALGAEGRTVRCARCRHTWFARAEDLVPEAVLADSAADGQPEAEYSPPEPVAPLIQPVVPWNDMVMVEAGSSPPLVPDVPAATAVPTVLPSSVAEINDVVVSTRRKIGKNAGSKETRLGLVALLLGFIVVVGYTAREPLVRGIPSLAGFFATIGVPVNLRGIEFRDLRTSHETQDGVSVLIIEGDLENPTRYTRDIPRLRLSVLGAENKELYSWTALLPRETLLARESLTFRSRLASPPEEGERVAVRFLLPSDLTDAH
jgi:predicted Zn finger-like uncharacterized protein